MFERQNEILKSFLAAQKVYESLGKYIKDNLNLLQKINPSAYAKAMDAFKKEKLSAEKYNQFKTKIRDLKKQFNKWDTEHKKQIVALQAIKDAFDREFKTSQIYQDFYKVGNYFAAEEKYGKQYDELKATLIKKYAGDVGNWQNMDALLHVYQVSMPSHLYHAEFLMGMPSSTFVWRYVGEGALDLVESNFHSLDDLLKKISIKNQTVTAK